MTSKADLVHDTITADLCDEPQYKLVSIGVGLVLRICNVTPHTITFAAPEWARKYYGQETISVPPSGHIVNARPVEEPAGEHPAGPALVRTRFETDPASLRVLDTIEGYSTPVLVVGSIIAAQAYPGRVLALVPAPGFERVPIEQKRMRLDKFTTFAEASS